MFCVIVSLERRIKPAHNFLTNLTAKVTLSPMKSASIRHAARRGAFHAVIGLAVVAALFFLPRFTVVAALAVVTAGFLSLEAARLYVPSLNKYFSVWFASLLREEERSKLTGSSYFLIGCLITVLAFRQDIATLAILFLSLGDPTATVVGMWKRRVRLWGKSIEGNIACLTVCLFTGIPVATILENLTLTVAIVGAVFATLFQALPLRLSDNLTIPLGSAITMTVTSILT